MLDTNHLRILRLALLLPLLAYGTSFGANFAVCPTGATSASSCGADPNLIGGSDFLVGSVSAQQVPQNPFLILLAIPNQGDSHSIPFTVPISTVAAPGPDIYGGTWNPATGLVTTSFISGEVYSASGLSGGSNSMSFANFSGTGSGQNGSCRGSPTWTECTSNLIRAVCLRSESVGVCERNEFVGYPMDDPCSAGHICSRVRL